MVNVAFDESRGVGKAIFRHLLIIIMSWIIVYIIITRYDPSNEVPTQTTSTGEFPLNKIFKDVKDTLHPKTGGYIQPLAIERRVGTEGHRIARTFLVDKLKELNLSIDIDEFKADTVIGEKTFYNIIGTSQPKKKDLNRVILAAHYDSKDFGSSKFIGATDSIVPIALILEMITFINPYVGNEFDLQVIFFDGEEAFVNWTNEDSIYGAKHLAQLFKDSTQDKFKLDRIEIFILLDLLGTKNPTFHNYFQSNPKSSKYFQALSAIETNCRNLNLLKGYPNIYFNTQTSMSGIEDDHIPFLSLNVPILHIIPYPFPAVWHQLSDDQNALHYDTIYNLNLILKFFLFELISRKKFDFTKL